VEDGSPSSAAADSLEGASLTMSSCGANLTPPRSLAAGSLGRPTGFNGPAKVGFLEATDGCLPDVLVCWAACHPNDTPSVHLRPRQTCFDTRTVLDYHILTKHVSCQQ
jgi:hypothetical protein